jgi:hypothetical protein
MHQARIRCRSGAGFRDKLGGAVVVTVRTVAVGAGRLPVKSRRLLATIVCARRSRPANPLTSRFPRRFRACPTRPRTSTTSASTGRATSTDVPARTIRGIRMTAEGGAILSCANGSGMGRWVVSGRQRAWSSGCATASQRGAVRPEGRGAAPRARSPVRERVEPGGRPGRQGRRMPRPRSPRPRPPPRAS